MTDHRDDGELSLDPPYGPAPPTTGPRSAWWRSAGAGLAGKLAVIAVLVAALDVAIGMVGELVAEREARLDAVRADIGAVWGDPQTLSPPVLAVPVGVPGASPGLHNARRTGTAWLLADTAELTVDIEPQVRRRGLFETVVYTATVSMDATLNGTAVDALGARDGEPGVAPVVFWPEARVLIGITDPKGVRAVASLAIGDRALLAQPAGADGGWLGAAIAAPLGLTGEPDGDLRFTARLVLNGSQRLAFLPGARQTRVQLTTGWPHPGFDGAYLPVGYDTRADGASAHWNVSHFGRGYPQVLATGDVTAALTRRVAGSAFGVRLVQPVTPYRHTERAVKYGVLFLVFTFAFVFIAELAGRRPVHVVQYAAIGAPLTVFFVLLVAFAEHVGFALAYALGAGAVLAQIGWYLHGLFASGARTAFGCALLAGQYGFLYTLLELESYSLLWGSVGLWLLAGVFMFMTRRMRRHDAPAAAPA